MNTLQDRLNSFLEYLQIPMQAFERQCGIGQGLGSRLSNRSYATTFKRIEDAYPQLNINWLKTGEGQMLNTRPNVDIDLDLNLHDHSQFAMRDITNIGEANVQIAILQERINSLEKELREKDKRIEELNTSLERERKMNDYLMDKE